MSSSDLQRDPLQGRFTTTVLVMLVGLLALLWRMVELHVIDHKFLQDEGDARHLRVVPLAAHRGMITDRNGDPLAISTPVQSVWGDPRQLVKVKERWAELASALDIPLERLEKKVEQRRGKDFLYLRRHITPQQATRVMDLQLTGLSLEREYRRYYPTGEVSAHIVGFTDIDDKGKEGVELMLNDQLRALPGKKRVVKDRLGRMVENVEEITAAHDGRDVALSIDRRIQYLAYRQLKAAVQRNGAKSGSAVVLDVRSGEVLAMVNQPSYNPNNRGKFHHSHYRNRAVTDNFEPGSVIKPMVMAAALEGNRFNNRSTVDTAPGSLSLGGFTIRDPRNYGVIDLSTIIEKSSNVGMSHVALGLPAGEIWESLNNMGFGYPSHSGFPGESSGVLKHAGSWRDVDKAAISYGYGISVTALQLAQAYGVIANDGELLPISLIRQDLSATFRGKRVISTTTARQLRTMLERVVNSGTGTGAKVHGYRVAGKTGTARKATKGGYDGSQYLATFVGMVPASDPRLVMVVMIDEPSGNDYHGGKVAAPVFVSVMDGALRLLGIPADAIEPNQLQLAAGEVAGR